MTMMRTLIYSLILFICALPAGAQCDELVWSEEFDYAGLPDPETWTMETGAGGWGNNELQYYRADTSNALVDNGILTITARKEAYGGSSYTSSRLITRDKVEFQYGRIEARMRLPYGQGIWPAFWLMGENSSEVGWPACGETDIMEMVGGDPGDRTVHGTVHWDNNGSHASYGKAYSLPSGRFADDFHLFAVQWTPRTIKWYVDSTLYNTIDITPAGLSEFHHPFFVLLNLAVGGNWPGSPDATTVFPQRLEVDYIRLYKSEDMLDIQGSTSVMKKQMHLKYTLPCVESWGYQWSLPEDAEIVSGQGTGGITVNWGCLDGEVACIVTGSCGLYHLSLPVAVSAENEIRGPMFANAGARDLLFCVTEMSETSYAWSVPEDAEIEKGQGSDSILVSWGSIFTGVSVITTNSCGSDTLFHQVYETGQYPYPDPLVPHAIPGVISATDYDYGGEGIAYHDLTAANEGPGPRQDERVDTENRDNGTANVGWIRSGEWLEYTIEVEKAGNYDLSLRVATDNSSGGPFSILVNGEERMDPIPVAGTGGWDRFVTIRPGSILLDVSDTLMRLDFTNGDFNLGKMTFQYNATGVDVPPQNGHTLSIYPNPAGQLLRIHHPCPESSWQIIGLDGSVILEGEAAGQLQEVDISGLGAGSYLVRSRTPGGEMQTGRFIKLPE
jgi:beta-glucanase (GH16 family)